MSSKRWSLSGSPQFFVLLIALGGAEMWSPESVVCWLENDNLTTKITKNGAKSCTNRFGCQIAIHTMAAICTRSKKEFVKIILVKTKRTISEICTRIVQIFLAPKLHYYLLQNLYQPGSNNCRRHYVPFLLHITHHKKITPPPPPPPP